MTISKQEARRAFYQAAENIERNPELYDFFKTWVGDEGCRACMWGHVGRVIGAAAEADVFFVGSAFGLDYSDLFRVEVESAAAEKLGHWPQYSCATSSVALLRACADYHFPEEKTFLPSTLSFTELMDSLRKEAA